MTEINDHVQRPLSNFFTYVMGKIAKLSKISKLCIFLTTIKAAKMFPLVGGQCKSLDVLIRVDTQIRLTHMKFNCS